MKEYKQIETITIDRDGERPLKFSGYLVASGLSSFETGAWNYSGETGVKRKLFVYFAEKTGKYILHDIQITCWRNERDTSKASIFSDIDSLLSSIKPCCEKNFLVDDLKLSPIDLDNISIELDGC